MQLRLCPDDRERVEGMISQILQNYIRIGDDHDALVEQLKLLRPYVTFILSPQVKVSSLTQQHGANLSSLADEVLYQHSRWNVGQGGL